MSPAGNRTVMYDTIDFSSPLGFIGRMVDRLGLERYMAKIIRERNEFLKAEAPTGDARSGVGHRTIDR